MIAALAAAALVASAQFVLADNRSVDDFRGEVIGEPPGGAEAADIVRASYGHGRGGRVWHKVTIAGRAPDPSRTGQLVPILFIDVPNHGTGARECDYFVGRFEGRIGLFQCGSLDRIAAARVTRTSEHSTRYAFSTKPFGSPRSYDWAFAVEGPSDGTWIRYDRLPDGDRAYLTHRAR